MNTRFRVRPRCQGLLAGVTLLLLLGSPATLLAEDGRESFLFEAWAGSPLQVFVSRPAELDAQTPVVMVMHGMRRNADEYRDQWHDLARRHGFLLAVPEFNATDFPGSAGYNLGRLLDAEGKPNPPELWSFAVPEALFDDLRRRYQLAATRYSLYGHSAGGQFVHRFLLHRPEARLAAVVAANAGWYTLPENSMDYPFGVRNSAVSQQQLAQALQAPLVILLGDRDIDPRHASLNRDPQAMQQGPHRLARGFNFFESGRQAAEQLAVPFGWHLAIAQGVAHSNAGMAPVAVPFLLTRPTLP